MRLLIAGVLVVFCSSCREILPLETSTKIQGFQLDGVVTSPNGVPVDGVEVRLYYTYDFYSDTPSDTVSVIVTDPSRPVDIAVYTTDLTFVRQLFLGYRQVGPVPRWSWDGYDASGVAVPSGKYLIRYVVDTVIVKFSPVLATGHITAKTDARGHFTISSRNLPIGEHFDLFNQFSQYAGTYEIPPSIDLTLRKGTAHAAYTNISLITNQITKTALTIQ